VRTVDLGNGAQVVPQAKLARMTWRTHEWISRAEEEDIPIDVICSPVPVRRTEMIQAAIERGAGIDVGKKWLAVCIMVGPLEAEPRTETRRFGTNVADLEQLRDWFREEGITHAVMESTGSYWKPVFNILEEAVTVYLANPHQVKPRKGHKTDNKDGHWLAHLLRHAMIQPSFIPPRGIRELRDLTRRRKKLIGAGTSEKNRIQKVLEDANVKLGNVLSDLFGVSGQLMLEALLDGKAGPQEIAQMAKRRARKKIPELVAALEQHRMSDHHRQMMRYSVQHMELLERQIAQLDEAIAAKIREIGLEKQWELLQSIPGLQASSSATILAETGGDMRQFGDERNLSSWGGVCPGNNRSAGKNKSSHTNKGNPWLRSALTECAQGASKKKNCFLKDKFWRITTKHGGKRAPAVIAVAHNLLQFVFLVLSTGQPYKERTATPLAAPQRERMIRHHIRRLGKLGMAVGQRGPAPRPRRRTTTAKGAATVVASTSP
jgi:transposase